MSDLKKEFFAQNTEYSRCLNEYYDKFLEGQDINFDNVCQDKLEKMKNTGEFYKDMQKEFEKYQIENAKEKEKEKK
jgi:hypothetical protein